MLKKYYLILIFYFLSIINHKSHAKVILKFFYFIVIIIIFYCLLNVYRVWVICIIQYRVGRLLSNEVLFFKLIFNKKNNIKKLKSLTFNVHLIYLFNFLLLLLKFYYN